MAGVPSPGSRVNRPFFCRHRGTTEGSAVCVFSMKDVQRAFDGFYKAVNRETLQWYTVAYEVPTPRPGSVRTAPCAGLGDLGGGGPLPAWDHVAPPSPSRLFSHLESGDKSPGLLVPLG